MASYWSLDVLLLTVVLMLVIYFYLIRNYNYWEKRGVLQIPPVPLFGNFMKCTLLQLSPGKFFKDLYDQAKDLPCIGFYLHGKPALVIRDQNLVKNILIKEFNYFANRYRLLNKNDRIGCANLFFLKNPAWKMLRKKLTPFFTSGKLKHMFKFMMQCSNNMDKYLISLEFEGKERMIDVKDLLAKFTTDLIGNTAYGIDTKSITKEDSIFRVHEKNIFNCNNWKRNFELMCIFFCPKIVRLSGITFLNKNTNTFLRDIFWQTLNQRVKSGVKRNDLIDILIELKDTYGDQDFDGFRFDSDDLVSQTIVFLIGGFETTASTTSFVLYSLALHPEIQDKVRKEIFNALETNNGEITYNMMNSLNYMDKVISETLRLYPILPFLDRVATQDYKVPDTDLVIEKDTPIYISVLGMHYNPDYFPNPEEFNPERFSEENKYKIPSCAYTPFGDGPHDCIAKRFGLLAVKMGLIIILKRFELTPCEKTLIPMQFSESTILTTPHRGTLYLNFRKLNEGIN